MDVYDEEIAYLKENPTKTIEHWLRASPLFGFCSPDRTNKKYPHEIGCLLMVRDHPDIYQTTDPSLTEEVANDPLLPEEITLCTPARDLDVRGLERIAFYQRRMDLMWSRPVPTTFLEEKDNDDDE